MEPKFSKIIQGCMTWGAWGKQLPKNEMVSLLKHCIDAGITTFDHADIYGDYTTESEFGAALSESGVARDDIQVISKCGIQYVGETRDNEIKHYQYDADYIIWSAEKSIADLQCDYLDLLLLHRPSPLMDRDEVKKGVAHLMERELIRSFGVSNFTVSQMQLIDSREFIYANQIEFSLTSHQAMFDGTLDFMQLNAITPMCWSPLGKLFREDDDQTQRIHALLDALTEKYNASKDQLLLAWILKHPAGIHPVVGTTSKDRISLAAEAAKIDLSRVDWFKMLVASQGHKVP
ncbi:aldo/keto reductase [Aureisphaera galaxeae]|uniref:aldo/keto reductase n=1 Tax=Aureisphaera galaxeae TaxID=1538023 RepID=UPI00234FDC19|nr:aldo/keto reductase [Aureisphaera galaxeae]MDC8005288.1 aldo/keto reductase [Aureisphaera galaxeae]